MCSFRFYYKEQITVKSAQKFSAPALHDKPVVLFNSGLEVVSDVSWATRHPSAVGAGQTRGTRFVTSVPQRSPAPSERGTWTLT